MPGGSPRVSVCVPAFQAERYLGTTIDSVLGQTFGDWELIVLDNGSTDGSKAVLEELTLAFPGLVDATFLRENRGTTAPRNLGFAEAKADHLLVIDSDIHFRKPVLAKLTEELAADPSIGIIAPRLIFPDGRRQISTDVFPTLGRKLERLFRLRALERQDARVQQSSDAADYAISAFWLMRRDLIDRIGPLDERIFYAPEDVDFCLRAWLHGKRVVYRPDLEVVHDAKERSRSLKGLLFTWRHILGLAYFFKKHGYILSADKLYRRIGRPRSSGAAKSIVTAQKIETGVGG